MATKTKPAKFGQADGFSWAVKVDGIDNEFFKLPFGRRLDDQRKAKELENHPLAKKYFIDAKRKATLASVKAWAKEFKPQQFYAMWKSDSDNYKDDSVMVIYIPEENGRADGFPASTKI